MDPQKMLVAGIIIALLVGVGIGYAISMGEVSQLKAKVASLESQLKAQGASQEGCVKTSGLVEKIKERGYIILGTSADWPPFEYIDKQGNYVGIDIEIAKKIAEKLGVKLVVKDMKFAALIQSLQDGKIDMILADMTPTPDREKVVDFSIPYYFSKGNAVVVLKSSNIQSLEDLKGKKVGVQLGTIQEDWAKEHLKDIAQIASYDKVYPDMVMVLKRGDVAAIIVSDMVGEVLLKKDPDLKIAFYAGGSGVGGAVAVPQCAEDLKYVVNSVIYEMLQNGQMKQIFQQEIDKWLSSQG